MPTTLAVGKINLCSPDHISLLLHRTFNVSIPRHHIPQDQWVFEYGPAENDPEFGAGRRDETENASGDIDMGDGSSEEAKTKDDHAAESSGQWVHHLTGEKLGSPDGYVEFTVIGCVICYGSRDILIVVTTG